MSTPSVSSLLASSGIAVTLVEGSWTGRGSIDVAVADETFEGGALAGLIARRALEEWALARSEGRRLFNRPPARAGKLRLEGWDRSGSQLHLETTPTWYSTYLATNRLVARDPEARSLLATADVAEPLDLRRSSLANALSVTVVLIDVASRPRQVLIQRPSPTVARGEMYRASSSGFIDAPRPGRRIDPVTTAVAETRQETGIAIAEADVTFLALCRALSTFSPGLCAVAKVGKVEPGGGRDAFEVDRFEWWPYDRGWIEDRLASDGGWASFHPLSAAAMLHALSADLS